MLNSEKPENKGWPVMNAFVLNVKIVRLVPAQYYFSDWQTRITETFTLSLYTEMTGKYQMSLIHYAQKLVTCNWNGFRLDTYRLVAALAGSFHGKLCRHQRIIP